MVKFATAVPSLHTQKSAYLQRKTIFGCMLVDTFGYDLQHTYTFHMLFVDHTLTEQTVIQFLFLITS